MQIFIPSLYTQELQEKLVDSQVNRDLMRIRIAELEEQNRLLWERICRLEGVDSKSVPLSDISLVKGLIK